MTWIHRFALYDHDPDDTHEICMYITIGNVSTFETHSMGQGEDWYRKLFTLLAATNKTERRNSLFVWSSRTSLEWTKYARIDDVPLHVAVLPRYRLPILSSSTTNPLQSIPHTPVQQKRAFGSDGLHPAPSVKNGNPVAKLCPRRDVVSKQRESQAGPTLAR